MSGRVTGFGGFFFRSEDPEALQAWYEEHLGFGHDPDGAVVFRWGPDEVGSAVFAPFPPDTDYFGPETAPFMINFRVDDLDSLLDQLRAAGVRVDDLIHQDETNGRFAWAWDPEGRRFELWEPYPGM